MFLSNYNLSVPDAINLKEKKIETLHLYEHSMSSWILHAFFLLFELTRFLLITFVYEQKILLFIFVQLKIQF